MKTVLLVSLCALYLLRAASMPLLGTWEGYVHGRKATMLEIRERDGIIGGRVTVYITHDNGDGSLDGTPLHPEAMQGTTWDGKVLRFHAGPASYELRPVEADRAELRLDTSEHTETLHVRRVRQ